VSYTALLDEHYSSSPFGGDENGGRLWSSIAVLYDRPSRCFSFVHTEENDIVLLSFLNRLGG
jgi:hypothetical protein